jgi:hypothetical protein
MKRGERTERAVPTRTREVPTGKGFAPWQLEWVQRRDVEADEEVDEEVDEVEGDEENA